MNKKILLILTISVILITLYKYSSGSAPTIKISDTTTTAQVQNVLNSDLNTLWSEKFDHYQPNLLKNVAFAISTLSRDRPLSDQTKIAKLIKLSYYLRIYSQFGADKGWSKDTAQAVNQAMFDLQNIKNFYQISPKTVRLHENFAVALYQLFTLEPLQPYVSKQINTLVKLLASYSQASAKVFNTDTDYALWEILRASAVLPYHAYSKDNKALILAVTKNDELQQALINFAHSRNATRSGNSADLTIASNKSIMPLSAKNATRWPQQHAFWALANIYNVYNKQYWHKYEQQSDENKQKLDDDKMSLPIEEKMANLDDIVWHTLAQDNSLSLADKKQQFSIPYVVTTFRGKSACKEQELKDRCILPTITQALPIKHVCSASLYILTQQMTNEQLLQTCKQLTSQEDNFHQKLATHQQPVANDHNDKLRVVIFNDASQYNIYGQLLFDISTNNGGMYIEGTPQDPDNIGTFYSYEHFWARPKFAVWNLNHEYVHYLDGRFIKYDTFGHFPDSLVWWSEGLAEYISKEDDNVKAFTLLHNTEQDKWPSLESIFATKYKEGTDKVYKWGYLAVRFMNEKHHDEYLKLANFLKTDYFAGYKKLLSQYGKDYQQEFRHWLTVHNDNFVEKKQDIDNHKPRPFSHYAYKTYLLPVHLFETKEHMVWQYWHDNK